MYSRRLLTWLYILFIPIPLYSITLDRAIETALRNNSEFLSYKLQVKAQLMRVKQATSPFYPTLDITNQYTRNYHRETGISDTTNSYLSIYYNIFRGGQDYYSFLSEKSQLFSAIQDFCEKGLDLIAEVKKTYFEALKRKELIDARRKILESSKYHLKLAERKYSLGLSNRADVMKARVDVREAEANLTLAVRDYKKSLNTLARLIGTENPLTVAKLKLGRGFKSFDEKKLYEKLKNLPKVKKWVYAKKRYEYLAKTARGEYLPSVDMFLNYGFEDKGYRINPRKRFYSFGVKMELNLFSGFSTKNKIEEYISKKKEASLQLQEMLRRARERLKNSILDYRASISIYKTDVEREKEAKEDLRVSEGRYAEGIAPFIELKDAQANYRDALTKRISSYYEVLKYEAEVERSYGEYLDYILSLINR